MDFRSYAQFVSSVYTTVLTPPVSTWWPWRGRTVHIARGVVGLSLIHI